MLDFEMMKAPNPKQNSSGDWFFAPRMVVCGIGAFFIGYGIYDYLAHGHYLSVLIFDVVVGLLLFGLAIFTSDNTFETIVDAF